MIVRTYQSDVRRVRYVPPPPPKPKRPHRPLWTAKDVAALDDMLARGLSLHQIARKIGRTRNAVIGFDWRRRQA